MTKPATRRKAELILRFGEKAEFYPTISNRTPFEYWKKLPCRWQNEGFCLNAKGTAIAANLDKQLHPFFTGKSER
jgi:hypothetical protein